MEVEWLWPHQHLGQQQGPQVQVQGGKVVKVLPQSLLLCSALLLAPFLAKELQQGPELQEAGGPASLLAEKPRVWQGPQESVLHLQELHLLPLPPLNLAP